MHKHTWKFEKVYQNGKPLLARRKVTRDGDVIGFICVAKVIPYRGAKRVKTFKGISLKTGLHMTGSFGFVALFL